MGTLTIRNLDDAIIEQLKIKAKDHDRSLEAEVREILKQVVARPSKVELLALADRIAAMTPKGVKQTDSAELLREDRDR